MTKVPLLLQNARALIGDSLKSVDILVEKGVIKKISKPFSIKKTGVWKPNVSKYVTFPGLIDAHTHFKLKMGKGLYNADDFISGTRACTAGGITSIVDFTHQKPGQSLLAGIRERLRDARGSYCDYSFHCILPSFRKLKSPARQIREAVRNGVPTFKIFTAYKSRGLMLPDAEILELLKTAKEAGAMVCVHAESEKLIAGNLKKIKTSLKELGMKAHLLLRNDATENEAVKKLILLNKKAGGLVYFVHVSSGKSADLIRKARNRKEKIMAETCPQYLILNGKIYGEKNGHLYSFCPPARSVKDNLRLWESLGKGVIQNLATDSCAFTRAQKDLWEGEITRLNMGIASSQLLFPLVYTFGVRKGKITLAGLKNLLAANPAKIMGLYGKGEIREGNQADFAVFDLSKKFTVSWENLYHKSDYSAYEGKELWGRNKFTFLRGELVARNGKTLPGPRGKFIKRTLPEFI